MSKDQVEVLIVDADAQRCSSLKAHLNACGYSAGCVGPASFSAEKGDDSPKKLLSEPACLLLCHHSCHHAPGGVSDLDLGSIPVIVYAENPSAESVISSYRAGAFDFVITGAEVLKKGRFDDVAASVERALHDLDSANELQSVNSELKRHLRALELDQSAGRVVQRKLMPDSPVTLAGIEIEFQIVPSLYLSGDAIDFGLFGSRFVAFYLLDVSGHSAASAFIGVWVKQIVRGFFKGVGSRKERKPLSAYVPELLSLINQELINAEIGHHLTAFVGVLDTKTLELSYVVAGHLPLPLLHSESQVIDIVGSGKPLGIFADATWSPSLLTLPDTFSMIVCSDGVLELLPESDLISKEQGLKTLIQRQQPTSLKELEALLLAKRKAPLPDDVALLILSKV